jgi:hypothetical protein
MRANQTEGAVTCSCQADMHKVNEVTLKNATTIIFDLELVLDMGKNGLTGINAI